MGGMSALEFHMRGLKYRVIHKRRQLDVYLLAVCNSDGNCPPNMCKNNVIDYGDCGLELVMTIYWCSVKNDSVVFNRWGFVLYQVYQNNL